MVKIIEDFADIVEFITSQKKSFEININSEGEHSNIRMLPILLLYSKTILIPKQILTEKEKGILS